MLPARPLVNQHAFVSGAGRGIGRGIAVELAAAGAMVHVNDRVDGDDVRRTVAMCKDAGGDAHPAIMDVTDRNAMRDGLIEIGQSGLDIVVSNAAYSDRRLMIEQPLDEFDRTIDVSMMGAYHTVRFGAQAILASPKRSTDRMASIVVISSPHAHVPAPGALAYNMAKAACDQLAGTAAVELARHRIRVNTVHPGWIDTPGERKFFTESKLQSAGDDIAMGRLGRPDDIGRAVVFLCDPRSDYITGSTLTVDGGIQLPFDQMYRIEQAKAAAG